MSTLILVLLIGAGATGLMDLWAIFRKHALGVPPLDYALVGRWIGYLPRGRFFHHHIAATPAVPGECAMGWIAHYGIGIVFAAALIGIGNDAWLCHPTVGPALFVGVASVAAPFFVLLPALGAGIAASRTPRPALARFHSLVTHTVFGLGLYLSGWVVSKLSLSIGLALCAQ